MQADQLGLLIPSCFACGRDSGGICSSRIFLAVFTIEANLRFVLGKNYFKCEGNGGECSIDAVWDGIS